MLIYFSVGLWVFLSPMQDLPRIPIGSFFLRIGYIGLLVIFPIMFLNYKKYWGIIIKEPLFLLCNLIIIYNIFLLVHHADLRAVGFLIWLIFNCIFLLISSQVSFDILFKLVLFSQIINSLYIILSNYFHSYLILPTNYEYYNFMGHVRSYAFLGEPSYVSLLFFPTLILSNCYLTFKKRIITNLLLITACGLTYARISMFCLALLPFVLILPKFSRSNYLKAFFIPFLISASIIVLANPIFWGFSSNSKSIINSDSISRTINKGSTSTRISAFEQGWFAFKENPLYGVGLGNSKNHLSQKNSDKNNVSDYPTGLHNLFLEIIVEQGVIGFTLFLLLLARIVHLNITCNWKPTATALLALIFVPMQLSQNVNMPAMWIFLSLAYAEIYQKQKKLEMPTGQHI